MNLQRPLVFALALALASATTPVSAQRASLADRVAALEQRAASPQNVDLVNQITQLRSEVQALRGQLEEAQQANEQLRNSIRAQYLDVDGRLQRLEGGASTTASAPATPPPATSAPRGSAAPKRAAPAAPAKSTRPASPPAAASGSATPTGAELTAYTTAFDALKAGRYADASRLFTEFLDRYPGGVYAPNALYWLGESYYATRNYEQAAEPFSQLLDRFPTHDKAPGALLKLGLTRLNLHQDDAARAAFEGVVGRYAGSDAARSAADRLRAMGVTQ